MNFVKIKRITRIFLCVCFAVFLFCCRFYDLGNKIVGYKIDNCFNEEKIYNYEKNDKISVTSGYDGISLSDLSSGYFYQDDNRVVVTNTQSYPYKAVCRITVQYDEEQGIEHQGTGFLVGPHTILTACHVVYHEDYQWFNTIHFAFGAYYDETTESIQYPYGNVSDWCSAACGSYFGTYDANDDWALIDFNTNYGNELGYFGVSSNLISENSLVTLIGYHGDLNGNLGYGTGIVSQLYTYKFYHKCDTVGGSSGGPLVYNGNIAVGIQHGYFNDNSNAIACKISSYIVGWIQERNNS